jgi:hypothetical protein
LGIDKHWSEADWDMVDQVRDQYPQVHIERGYMLEWGTREYGECPEYGESPVETIIVRPIVKWYGRFSRG